MIFAEIRFQPDGFGSVVEITDENGEVVEQYEYTPFGKTTIKDAEGNALTKSAIGNRFMFRGTLKPR
jgi:uncharacterized protein RhaS with RHS repeats